jgi:hypothetical protein
LKKWVGNGVPIQDHLPTLHEDSRLFPQAIIDQRCHQGTTEVMVHWQGLSPAEATWEPLSEFELRFPSFALADKGNFKNGGVLHTYVRRGKRVQEAKEDLARVQGEATSSG